MMWEGCGCSCGGVMQGCLDRLGKTMKNV